jgi:hypothetical protein
MLHFLGWCGLAVLIMVAAVNAAFMLVSPKAWFRLPSWLLLNGSLTAREYGSGPPAFGIRITGGMLLAGILWVLYDSLLRPR